MGTLSFSIGLARSGKSTFIEEWQKKTPNSVILSGDAVRFSLSGQRFQLEVEPLVKPHMIIAAKALLHVGMNVFWDDTNTHHVNVEDILRIDPNAKAYIFHCPIEVCIQRCYDTNQLDVVDSIKRMNDNLSVTLPMIARGDIKLNNFEEIGPKFRWIREGYWD